MIEVIIGIIFVVFISINLLKNLITVLDPFILIPFKIVIIIILTGLDILGIKLLKRAIKRRKADSKIDANGVITYGVVNYADYKDFTDKEESEAEICVYVPSEKRIRKFKEKLGLIIGCDDGSFVRVKYYNNDIKLLKTVNELDVPEDILKLLKSYVTNQTIVFNDDEMTDVTNIENKNN